MAERLRLGLLQVRKAPEMTGEVSHFFPTSAPHETLDRCVHGDVLYQCDGDIF